MAAFDTNGFDDHKCLSVIPPDVAVRFDLLLIFCGCQKLQGKRLGSVVTLRPHAGDEPAFYDGNSVQLRVVQTKIHKAPPLQD